MKVIITSLTRDNNFNRQVLFWSAKMKDLIYESDEISLRIIHKYEWGANVGPKTSD